MYNTKQAEGESRGPPAQAAAPSPSRKLPVTANSPSTPRFAAYGSMYHSSVLGMCLRYTAAYASDVGGSGEGYAMMA